MFSTRKCKTFQNILLFRIRIKRLLTDKNHACWDMFHHVCMGCCCIPERPHCKLVLWNRAGKGICIYCHLEELNMCHHSCKARLHKGSIFRSFSLKILRGICIHTPSKISISIFRCCGMATSCKQFLRRFHKDLRRNRLGICIENSLDHLLWELHKCRRFGIGELSNMDSHVHKIPRRNVTCNYKW
jgi:hypothetical protein